MSKAASIILQSPDLLHWSENCGWVDMMLDRVNDAGQAHDEVVNDHHLLVDLMEQISMNPHSRYHSRS